MKRISSPFTVLVTFILLFLPSRNLGLPPISTTATGINSSFDESPRFVRESDQLPLYFVKNDGQVESSVDYLIQGSEKTLYFSPDGVTFALRDVGEHTTKRWNTTNETHFTNFINQYQRWTVKLDFVGANPNVHPVGQDRTEAIISYFKGPQDQWHVELPTYSRIVYTNLWPGIDLVYYGTVNQLKHEFIVHPGADPAQIRLAYRGADVSLNESGQMLVTTPLGDFIDDTPVAYQNINERRVSIPVAYVNQDLAKNQFSDPQSMIAKRQSYTFSLGTYNPNQPLIIDPAIIVYCGYIGGNDQDGGLGIAVDSDGNAYIAGSTLSSESSFPVTVGPDLTHNGGRYDAFVVKVNATGSSLIYAGYIGGNGHDEGADIAVDNVGNALVTGVTASTETSFPVTVGPDLTHNGGEFDTFVAKVNVTGSDLVFAGYIGGNNLDMGYGIALDHYGSAYVAGWTRSDENSFPVVVGPDLTYNGGTDYGDAFVAKVNALGTGLDYAGYIGGNGDDYIEGIAVSSDGNAYAIGHTESTEVSFPVTIGPDLTYNGGGEDAFVVKVNATGSDLVYAGYIGGIDGDKGTDLAVDIFGSVYVTGRTRSTETSFPVTGGPDLSYNGGSGYGDAFVAKVNSSGESLDYAGYIGGTGNEWGIGIAVDGAGNAYITGFTASTEASFPVVGGPDLTYNGGAQDAFVVMVNATGSDLVYGGYIGGIGSEYGTNITVDRNGNAYLTGWTTSSEYSFPVAVGPDLTINGIKNAFITKVASPYYSISGQVTDSSGNPIAGVRVLANAGVNGKTDNNGYYEITIVPNGSYTITPMLTGYSFTPTTRSVNVPPDVVTQDFTGTVTTWFTWLSLIMR